jgi:hypothetical protein
MRNVRGGSVLSVGGPEVVFLHDASAAKAIGQTVREQGIR